MEGETRRIDICSVGLVLQVDHDSEDDSRVDTTDSENELISVEEGDQILVTGLLPPPSMEIHASSTISQRLAEAFQTNMEAVTLVPECYIPYHRLNSISISA